MSGPASSAWDTLIATLPKAQLLQTWEWGEIKSHIGWKPFHYVWFEENGKLRRIEITDANDVPAGKPAAAALVLLRTVNLTGLSARILYIPKGPLLDWRNESIRRQVLSDLAGITKELQAIFIKIDPDVTIGTGIPGSAETQECQTGQLVQNELRKLGWRPSAEQVQFRNTMLIDLSKPEEELLALMKQKTRYNVRLADRKGVTIRVGNEQDIPELYQMYAETSVRDGFVIRDFSYYQTTWQTFIKNGLATPLIAEVEGEVVAGIILFIFAGSAWYLFGMSRDLHRDRMPNYLLQWAAIRHAKAAGCLSYDLWGAPDTFDEKDSMWGVYRFKEGLGAQVVRNLGAWDLPMNQIFYQVYTRILPRILDVMRWRGKSRTRQQVGV